MSEFKEVSHKNLGLTGKERTETVRFKTFCNLCRRQVPVGSTVLVTTDETDREYYLHKDCALARMTQMHNEEFRQYVKTRPGTTRTGRPVKKVHAGDDAGYCNFCGFLTKSSQSYVKDGKKRYHHPGRRSCWERYKEALQRDRRSLT